jgi:hypothetical protein
MFKSIAWMPASLQAEAKKFLQDCEKAIKPVDGDHFVGRMGTMVKDWYDHREDIIEGELIPQGDN